MGYWEYDGNQQYLDKITSEHRIRPKFMAMAAAYLGKLQDVYAFYMQILQAFDLDTAVGSQLDMIGEIVGASRILNFNPYYADSKLNDEQYRKLIRAQISTNQWDGTLRGLYGLWESIFQESYRIHVLDRQDMSIQLVFKGVDDPFEAELISRGYFSPRPEGVGVNYLFWFQSDVYGELFAGGTVVEESITDELKELEGWDSAVDQDVYLGAAIVQEAITEYLPSGSAPTSTALHVPVHFGGGIVYESITVYLEGGNRIE